MNQSSDPSNQNTSVTDIDPIETQEWLDSFADILQHDGQSRAVFLLEQLRHQAGLDGGSAAGSINTPYCNTIDVSKEAQLPDDGVLARRVRALIRWNAMAIVVRAGRLAAELGGHIASYASAATLYEVGFNYFFRATTEQQLGDMVFIQGHSAPGIYARAFLEGRLSEQQLKHFRQDTLAGGLSSYPHPWLMPDFWQFPTVSMGLGPMQAIYQARFLKYLEHRGLVKPSDRKVWAFLGDGEMDEPESLGCINVAGREHLDNLIFVVNCNLQRLDGPVRGNGSIIQELEGMFRGAGWHVIKLIWGSRWDPLFAKDSDGWLLKRMHECVDGEFQNYHSTADGQYIRQEFFGAYPELAALVADMTDAELCDLNRGGHDPQKIYAAYHAAVRHQGQPTVILAKTVKGYGMGLAGEGQNTTHQQKKMDLDALKCFRDRFDIPLDDQAVANVEFYRPAADSPDMQYLQARRQVLGGYLPERTASSSSLPIPDMQLFEPLLKSSGTREFSTTMAMVRIMNLLLKHQPLKDHIVPIVPDESRTFGMEGMFRQFKIYAPEGQLYTPEDAKQLMPYYEAKDGQILEEGINEAGAFCSWIAAATAYQNHQLPMIPFYIYYSMFGFQRIGDFAWAAADMRARGFLLGATAGRTTLAGEGLQHADGHSHVLASVIPNCRSYDPAFAYELAVIIHHGLLAMYQRQEDVYYYITIMNENYAHPALPSGIEAGIIQGMYQLRVGRPGGQCAVHLLGSGAILREVIKAADVLESEYQISAHLWSVTSFTELKREAMAVERTNRLRSADQSLQMSYVRSCLGEEHVPVIAATDYVRAYAEQIRTDGFGRSDTRVRLRSFFEVDCQSIVIAALRALADQGNIGESVVQQALEQAGIINQSTMPWDI